MTESNRQVGPVLRSGELADAVLAAVEDDNPQQEVHVVDRGDYVRIHTDGLCRVTRASVERHLGRSFDLASLEVEMPSFSGRLRTRHDEFVWYLDKP
jgi:toluene monooxygenase system protein D